MNYLGFNFYSQISMQSKRKDKKNPNTFRIIPTYSEMSMSYGWLRTEQHSENCTTTNSTNLITVSFRFQKTCIETNAKTFTPKKKEIKDNLLRRTKGYILMYFYIFSDMKTFKRRQWHMNYTSNWLIAFIGHNAPIWKV